MFRPSSIAHSLISAMVIGTLCASEAAAATVDRIVPAKGKVGQTAVVHGSGLGASVVVKFGSVASPDASNPGKSTDNIKCTIPLKSALDPQPVTVKVFLVVGSELQEATYPNGPLTFEYDPPGQLPSIASFEPSSVPANVPFRLTLTGVNFITAAGRRPTAAYAVGPSTVREGFIDVTFTTPTSIALDFGSIIDPSAEYKIVVGFSDGAGAEADGLVVR